MADLDDFFAKKDKKKSKVIKKFTASELLSTKQEDVAAIPVSAPIKKPVEPRKKEDNVVSEATENQKPVEHAEEEEWGEFEQERERDYSGLKIQKLQIQDSDEDEGDSSTEQELNDEGEPIKREPAGPWNKINAQSSSSSSSNAVKVKETAPIEVLPNTTGGVYIPPSKRNQPAGSASASSSSTGRTRMGKKEKGAPDLSNEEYFPSLSAAVAIEQNNFKLKKFEQTERGFTEAKPSRSHSSRAPYGDDGSRLQLGNKFSTLSNDD